MIKKKDITLLIQGRRDNTSLQTLRDNGHLFKEVIYSTWSGQTKEFKDQKIVWVSSKLPNVENKHNLANIYYQVVSTLNGLKKVKTKYVLKHRSDEKYNNVSLILSSFNPNKILCANIFFRPIDYCPYHISDHFFLAKTEDLIKTFGNLKKYIDSSKDEFGILNNQHPPEQLISLFYLDAVSSLSIKELLISGDNVDYVFDIMKRYIDIIDVELLKPYLIKHNHLSRVIDDFEKAHSTESMYMSKTTKRFSKVGYIKCISDIKKKPPISLSKRIKDFFKSLLSQNKTILGK